LTSCLTFEQSFAAYQHSKHAISATNGTLTVGLSGTGTGGTSTPVNLALNKAIQSDLDPKLRELAYLLAESEDSTAALAAGKDFLQRFGKNKPARTARMKRLIADCTLRLGQASLAEAIRNYQESLTADTPAVEKLDVLARLIRYVFPYWWASLTSAWSARSALERTTQLAQAAGRAATGAGSSIVPAASADMTSATTCLQL